MDCEQPGLGLTGKGWGGLGRDSLRQPTEAKATGLYKDGRILSTLSSAPLTSLLNKQNSSDSGRAYTEQRCWQDARHVRGRVNDQLKSLNKVGSPAHVQQVTWNLAHASTSDTRGR